MSYPKKLYFITYIIVFCQKGLQILIMLFTEEDKVKSLLHESGKKTWQVHLLPSKQAT